MPLALQRQGTKSAGLLSRRAAGVASERIDMAGVPALRQQAPASQAQGGLLLLHGGGFVLGGAASHGGLAAHLAEATATVAYLPDYRLAPEHPYPAALDDAVAAYRWLLQKHAPGRLLLAGDSAGGNLALATAIAIRDAGLPPPAAMVLLSPWLDLSLSGDSIREQAEHDPVLRPSWISLCARHYAGSLALDDPRVSPLFADLRGLPPLLIHVGGDEILLSDAQRLQQHAAAAGVDAELHCFEGLWHDFQLHAGLLAEADASLAEIGAFARRHLDAGPQASDGPAHL
jgi:acetyl esterase/lipase